MKKLHSITLGIGAAFSLLAFTSASRAEVVVDNLGSASAGILNSSTYPVGTIFTMSGSSDQHISSLTLELNNRLGSTETGTIYLYATSGGAPTGSGTQIGTFSSSAAGTLGVSIALSGTQPTLSANTTYAIVMQGYTANIEWSYTHTATSGGTGSSGIIYYKQTPPGTTWSAPNLGPGYGQMDLETVPEVPMTGVFMGFGALAIAVGHTLRRKYLAAKIA